MAIILIIALLLTGGATLAAEDSTPKDPLYPIKININERARAIVAVSETARAHKDITLAVRRLEEAEKLSAENELDAKIAADLEARFEAYAQRVEDRIKRMQERNSIAAAAQVNSNFEAALEAHARILERLSARESANDVLQPLRASVQAQTETSMTARAQVESRISVQTQSESKASAETSMESAESKLKEVQNFVIRNGVALGASATAQADARLKVAQETFTRAKAKFDAQAYAEAFVLFQMAYRMAEEVQTLAEVQLDITTQTILNADSRIQFDGGPVRSDDAQGASDESVKTNVNAGAKGTGRFQLDL